MPYEDKEICIHPEAQLLCSCKRFPDWHSFYSRICYHSEFRYVFRVPEITIASHK